MAEVEFAGVKFKGGKMVAVFLALSTLVGGLYGAFEVYKDYMDMKKQIMAYTAPDLSGFDKKLAVMSKTMTTVTKEMGSVRNRVLEMQQIVRDTRQDTRDDAGKLYSGISAVDRRSRTLDSETRLALRQAEKTLRDITESASTRFDNKINGVDEKLDTLEKRLDKKLQRALDNPLLRK
jgi:CRISPR/Cas system-associated protein Cas5 (RAMP superfamily)